MTDFGLECGACGLASDASPRATVCPDCGRPWLVQYGSPVGDGPDLAARWRRRSGGMWRFAELMPLRDGEAPVTLGEGDTPLLDLGRPGEELGLRLLLKDEGRNPTGSFKDRGLSAAVTRGASDGAPGFVIPSAGNAGVALAAYAARAGLPARVFLPEDTPATVEDRCRGFAAEVERVAGLITDCGRRATEEATATGAWNVSTLREPYRLEGKKTMMLEIAEALDWRVPDAVVYPTGGGTGLVATWKALRELASLGLAPASTRLYSVQSTGCAPIVRAFEEGERFATPWMEAKTAAWGLRVPTALGDFLILDALRASGGGAIAVPDEEMEAGAAELGRAGLNAGIEGGATLAAARRLRATGELKEGETVVLFNTGDAQNYGPRGGAAALARTTCGMNG
ncbi:MAG: threonine synthase [Gemmatimonadota bacterium]